MVKVVLMKESLRYTSINSLNRLAIIIKMQLAKKGHTKRIVTFGVSLVIQSFMDSFIHSRIHSFIHLIILISSPFSYCLVLIRKFKLNQIESNQLN